MQVRSSSGEMVPLSSLATFRDDSGPTRVVRYNLFPAVELQGQAAPGVSSVSYTHLDVYKRQVGNYANSTLRDRLLRLKGVGGVQIFGGGYYSMRVWIDPDKAAARNLTATEIVAALQSQNVQVAGGSVGAPPYGKGNPAVVLPAEVPGRLVTPEQFADVVIKTDTQNGAITRLKDVARVELGSQDYGVRGVLNGQPGVCLLYTSRCV